jgi:predicted regulator of Ras-like GTPase activity (Roadblock/LC7/MglB family)
MGERMSAQAISLDQARVLESALGDLVFEAEAAAVILSDLGGNVFASTRGPEGFGLDTLSALAAGSFAATRELARQMGESEFQSVYHHGEHTSIYIHGVASACLLTVIFDNQTTTVGLVKLYAGNLLRRIAPLLAELLGQDVRSIAGGETFEMDVSADAFEPTTASR